MGCRPGCRAFVGRSPVRPDLADQSIDQGGTVQLGQVANVILPCGRCFRGRTGRFGTPPQKHPSDILATCRRSQLQGRISMLIRLVQVRGPIDHRLYLFDLSFFHRLLDFGGGKAEGRTSQGHDQR